MAADIDVPSTASAPPAPPESLGAVARRTLVARPLAEHVRAQVQSGRSVLVVGDAGVGKTHLVTAALAHLWIGTPTSPMPTVVSVSGATCPAGIPLGALEPLLGDVAMSSLGSFARTVESLADSLRARSRGGPVILRVEDAHLLDPASSQALAWMVQQGDVQLVATARSSAVSQSPWLELWKDDVVERIDVPPFTLAEVQQWLVGELGGHVTPDTVRRVWSETAGNAFHLGEVVRLGPARRGAPGAGRRVGVGRRRDPRSAASRRGRARHVAAQRRRARGPGDRGARLPRLAERPARHGVPTGGRGAVPGRPGLPVPAADGRG